MVRPHYALCNYLALGNGSPIGGGRLPLFLADNQAESTHPVALTLLGSHTAIADCQSNWSSYLSCALYLDLCAYLCPSDGCPSRQPTPPSQALDFRLGHVCLGAFLKRPLDKSAICR